MAVFENPPAYWWKSPEPVPNPCPPARTRAERPDSMNFRWTIFRSATNPCRDHHECCLPLRHTRTRA